MIYYIYIYIYFHKSTNFFLYKNFYFNFSNKLLTKNIALRYILYIYILYNSITMYY